MEKTKSMQLGKFGNAEVTAKDVDVVRRHALKAFCRLALAVT